jgi:hypothetical protein
MLLGGTQNTIKCHLLFTALFCFAPFSVFSSRMSAPYCSNTPLMTADGTVGGNYLFLTFSLSSFSILPRSMLPPIVALGLLNIRDELLTSEEEAPPPPPKPESGEAAQSYLGGWLKQENSQQRKTVNNGKRSIMEKEVVPKPVRGGSPVV